MAFSIEGLVTTTSSTVAGTRITITAPARRGQRVYLVAASWTTDLDGDVFMRDDTALAAITCTTTNTSTTVTSAALFGSVKVGMDVSGTGIPANNYVTAVASTSSLTIKVAATATGTPTDIVFAGTPAFEMKSIIRATTIVQPPFVPPLPMAVGIVSAAASFTLNCTTTGQLSVVYGYDL